MSLQLIEADVLKEIRIEVEKYGLRLTARKRGVNPSQLSDILNRRRGISESVAKKFGYLRDKLTFIYFRKEKKDEA